MEDLLYKPFTFRCSHIEAYQSGMCTLNRSADIIVSAKFITDNLVRFNLSGDLPRDIDSQFTLPVYHGEGSNNDQLHDRFMYGRLPKTIFSDTPTKPVVCEVFNTRTCIRFALLSPLRIIEFLGRFE